MGVARGTGVSQLRQIEVAVEAKAEAERIIG
jgi:hypothetical protein